LDEAIERVLIEVHDAWPSWRLRNKRWGEIARRHVWRVRGAADAGKAITAMQRWLAELEDFHTWVRPVQTQVVLPYGAAVVDGQVVLTHVPWWTAGWAAGARPGWRLVGLDVKGTWATTPAAAHSKPLLVARRLLSGAVGEAKHLEARGANATTARWTEVHEAPSGTPASWEVLPSGTGYLWVGAWAPGLGVEAVIDEAFEALAGCPQLIVDLRGNGGGRLDMARAVRDRFLDRRRQLGWIQTTEPGGRLGAPRPLWGEPSEARRWTRPVRFLTSPLSYSSSEDCLLGLQGLPNVAVWGEPSGGGSGRLRRVRLLPGWRLTVTTSLTFDLQGRCIEGSGVPVDRLVVPNRRNPDGTDSVLAAADQGW
jgi:carboxyl-terminal processing protease